MQTGMQMRVKFMAFWSQTRPSRKERRIIFQIVSSRYVVTTWIFNSRLFSCRKDAACYAYKVI